MQLQKNYPFWIACFVASVGLFFAVLPLVQNSIIHVKAPHKYYLSAGALLFIYAGCRYGYLAIKGRLKRQGVTTTEVRKQALKKINSEAYLAKAAREDPDPEVRQTAIKELEKIEKSDNFE